MIPNADPRIYSEIKDTSKMVTVVEEYLDDYNATSTKKMPLVMFVDAVGHVARISRTIRQPLLQFLSQPCLSRCLCPRRVCVGKTPLPISLPAVLFVVSMLRLRETSTDMPSNKATQNQLYHRFVMQCR